MKLIKTNKKPFLTVLFFIGVLFNYYLQIIKITNRKIRIEYDDKIVISDKNIIYIPDGFIEIKKSSFGRKSLIVIEDKRSKLNKKYCRLSKNLLP